MIPEVGLEDENMLQNMMNCGQITERDDEDSRVDGQDDQDGSSEYTYYSETCNTASRVSLV